MARTVDQIKAELDRAFPPGWSTNAIGNAILIAIATVLRTRELAWDGAGGWLDQMFSSTATDAIYIDEHGKQFGLKRRPGESNADYKARQKFAPQILTPAVFRQELDAIMADPVIRFTEPRRNTLGGNFYLDDISSRITDEDSPRFLFWYECPQPPTVDASKLFLDKDYVGVGYMDELREDMERHFIVRARAVAQQMRAYGVGFGYHILPPEPTYGTSVETLEDAEAAILAGDVEDGEPVYIASEEVWALNYGGTPVKLSYPDTTSYQTDIDAGLIPEGSFTYIPDDNGNFVPTVNEGGSAVPAGSISTGGSICGGDTTSGSGTTRFVYRSRTVGDHVESIDQISIGSI